MEALQMVTRSNRERLHDAVVIDEAGRCMGVARAADLISGLAELKVSEAVTLNPLTHLPGSDSIVREVTRRIDRGEGVAVGWLDIDGFKAVNDIVGFAVGDDLIRSVGRSLTDAAATLASVAVGHVGGDDFLLVADPSVLEALASIVLDTVREASGAPVSLSLATLECAPGNALSYHEISQRLSSVKRTAKGLGGTSWVTSRFGSDDIDILRGHRERGNAHSAADGDSHRRSDIELSGESVVVGDSQASADSFADPGQLLARMHRSNQRFTDLLAVVPTGIALFDESERLVDANPALCDLLGYQLDELRGREAHQLTSSQPESGSWTSNADLISPTSRRTFIRSDGAPVHCELHPRPSVQDDGPASGWSSSRT